jgi:F0F1-type ATP synthase assembly protein I
VVAFPAVVPVDKHPSQPPPGRTKGAGGDWTRAVREAAPYLGLGTSLAISILGGLGLGYWLDGKLGTGPIFLLVGGAFGMFAAGYQFYKSVTKP